MRITDKEMQKVLQMGGNPASKAIVEIGEGQPADTELIEGVVHEVLEMPDREDRIDEVKAAIESGEYNPTGAEVADAMIRRAIADRIR